MPNIGDLTPPAPLGREYASVRPHDGAVGRNANTIFPQEPQRPAPIRPVRQLIPPAKRIAEIESELATALQLANDAPGQYETAKQLPHPSPRLEKLRAKVQDLQQKLHAAQLELEAEEALPTPIQSFIDVALQLESNVQFLAGRLLVALTDRALEETFKVSREDAEPAVVKTISKRWKRLSNYQAFMSIHRAVQDHRVSELLIQNAIKRSVAALSVIADVLKENK